MTLALDPEKLAAYFLLDIAVILVAARLMGGLFRRFRQPAVIGEIVAGILLGPTLLGNIPLGDGQRLGTTLFPPEVRPSLTVLANIGLILFMFIVGLELNLKIVRGNGRLAGGISLASVALPFALGALLARALYPSHQVTAGSLAFTLFIGASMSVTAFPVLARILTERSMHRIPLGVVALAAAAVDDVLAWSLLAVVTAVAEGTDQRHLVIMLGESLLFVVGMLFVVRPLLRRLSARYRRVGRLTPDMLAVVLGGLLLSSYLTSVIGIHSIFGAFIFGAVMPREDSAAFFEAILRPIEQISVLLFLPLFFVTTGFNVSFQGLGTEGLRELALIILVACVGKFVGAAGGARIQGFPTRSSLALGVLMNTRGLTELVILKVGLDKGVLDQKLFTLLVVMAVFTTVIAEPLLRVIYPDRLIARDIAAAERAAVTTPQAYRVLVATDDVRRIQPLVETALSLIRGREPAQIILSHFRLGREKSPTLEVSSGLTIELAHIAASMEELNRVAHSVEEQGVEGLVLDRSSSNMAADLSTQAATVNANVVLLDMRLGMADWRRVARTIAGDGSSRLLVADFLGGTRTENVCLCALSATRSDYPVLDVAIRLATVSSASLLLLDNSGTRRAARRIESTVDRLRRSGASVSVAKADDLPASRARVAVMALSDAFVDGGEPADTPGWLRAELTVLVQPLPDDDDDQLDEVLAQLGDIESGQPK